MSIKLYFPFRKKDFKHDNVAPHLRQSYKEAGIVFRTLRLRQQGQALVDVKNDDLVLIWGHGRIGTNRISCKGEQGKILLTANDLAAQLEDQGLSKHHGSLLMNSCNGGGSSSVGPGQSDLSRTERRGLSRQPRSRRTPYKSLNIQNNSAGECFASLLGKALGARGYLSVLVGGWPGQVVSGGGNDVFFDDGEGTKAVLAQLDHIQWFDCRGNNTAMK